VRVHRLPAALAHLTAARADTDSPYPRGLVGERLPSGFDAYVRVFHPFEGPDGSGTRRTWRALADQAGVTYHAELRWADLEPALPWEGERRTFEVDEGYLEPHARARLYAHLQVDMQRRRRAQATWFYYHDEALIWLGDLVLVEATLEESEEVEAWAGTNLNAFVSPTYVWPDDGSWMVHSDTDATSTFVGASRALADDLLGDAELEVLEVDRTTYLDDDSIRPGDG
jgi:hypothetical protein